MDLGQKILLERHLIYQGQYIVNPDQENNEYLSAYLLINFGIEITNKEYLNNDTVELLSEVFKLNVPSSFYTNPQDSKYFSCEELYIEQIISYLFGYGTDIKRIELFKKALPKYVYGDEIRFRKYTIIDKVQADQQLKEVASSLASFTRPFSECDSAYFTYLVKNNYFDEKEDIKCRDNMFNVIEHLPSLISRIDKKDLVKYSLEHFGENKKLNFNKDPKARDFIIKHINDVKDCSLSKRQAKYFNRLVKLATGIKGKESNIRSPYKKFISLMKQDKVMDAATYLAKQGSLLERNLTYILSRAKKVEVNTILGLINANNPLVLLQYYYGVINARDDEFRTFHYFKDKRLFTYEENKLDHQKRRSYISNDIKETIKEVVNEKIKAYYSSKERIGKIYLSPAFKKVAIPLNTSASGKGLDIMPSGSRIPFNADYIRTFCYWKEAGDIDLAIAFIKKEYLNERYFRPRQRVLSWRNYASKPFGDLALSSGDCTSSNGAEYQDIDIKGMLKRKYRYAVSAVNAFGFFFNIGEIYQGLQIKSNLDTTAWDPKNIEFQMNIKGEGRTYTGFAIDLLNKEIIIVNTFMDSKSWIMDYSQLEVAFKYLSPHYLDFNMYDLLALLGEVVDNPTDADIVFDNEYITDNDAQKVVRAYNVEALANYIK